MVQHSIGLSLVYPPKAFVIETPDDPADLFRLRLRQPPSAHLTYALLTVHREATVNWHACLDTPITDMQPAGKRVVNGQGYITYTATFYGPGETAFVRAYRTYDMTTTACATLYLEVGAAVPGLEISAEEKDAAFQPLEAVLETATWKR